MRDDALVQLPLPKARGRDRVKVIRCDGLASIHFDAAGTAHLSFYASKSRFSSGGPNIVVSRLTMPRLALLQAFARVALENHRHPGRDLADQPTRGTA